MRTAWVLALAIALAACSDDAQPRSATATATATVTATERVTATETVTESPPGPVSTGPKPPRLEDPEPEVVTTEFPDDVELPDHGGHYVAVALAAREPFLMVRSDRLLRPYGYTVGIGQLACLDGAAEAYGLPSDTNVSYLLFEDVVDAFRFIDAYGQVKGQEPGPLGAAKVTTFCLD